MTQADSPELGRGLTGQEHALRTELPDIRDELADRDERFAVLEAEMWVGFEAREARHRQLLEEREQEWARVRGELAAREREVAALQTEIGRLGSEVQQRDATIAELTETSFLLRFRLQRILASPPGRLYASLFRLPGLNHLQRRRSRRYMADLARQRPS